MPTFKKIDDLIGKFIDFDILEDETPIATVDDDGNVVVLTHEEYAKFMEAKAEKETAGNKSDK